MLRERLDLSGLQLLSLLFNLQESVLLCDPQLLLLLDSLLLLLTARKTTFCICGEQCSCVVLILGLLGLLDGDGDDEDLDTEDLEGEEDLFLFGLMNLKGEALYLGLMSLTCSLHLRRFKHGESVYVKLKLASWTGDVSSVV